MGGNLEKWYWECSGYVLFQKGISPQEAKKDIFLRKGSIHELLLSVDSTLATCFCLTKTERKRLPSFYPELSNRKAEKVACLVYSRSGRTTRFGQVCSLSDRFFGLVEFRIQIFQLPKHESASVADRLVVYGRSKGFHKELEHQFGLIRTQFLIQFLRIEFLPSEIIADPFERLLL